MINTTMMIEGKLINVTLDKLFINKDTTADEVVDMMYDSNAQAVSIINETNIEKYVAVLNNGDAVENIFEILDYLFK